MNEATYLYFKKIKKVYKLVAGLVDRLLILGEKGLSLLILLTKKYSKRTL